MRIEPDPKFDPNPNPKWELTFYLNSNYLGIGQYPIRELTLNPNL